MLEKIDKLFKENKIIFFIIFLFSFQLSPITSLIFPDSPTLAKMLENIAQIGMLILVGVQWVSEVSPKLVEDLDSMELDREMLFKHNMVIILSAVVGVVMAITAYTPINDMIDFRIIWEISLILLTILIYLKGKYAQGKQEKKVKGVVIFFLVIIVLNSVLLYISYK